MLPVGLINGRGDCVVGEMNNELNMNLINVIIIMNRQNSYNCLS